MDRERETPLDRDRLKEVRQTDLTEGRINQDFVDWLKTKGTTWLLVLMLGLFGYAMVVKFRNSRMNYQTEAWAELTRANLPASLEDVAEKYGDVGSVAHVARLRAGEMLLSAVQSGKAIAAPGETAADLTAEQREDYLNRADRLFSAVVDADNQSDGMALLIATAQSGRAAVAESRGDTTDAVNYYERAAQRAEAQFPDFARETRDRAASATRYASAVRLPTRLEVSQLQQQEWSNQQQQIDPLWSESWLTDSVMPKN